jgi:hypothetical protein
MTETQKAIRAAVEATHKYETPWWVKEQLDNIESAYDSEIDFSTFYATLILVAGVCVGFGLALVVMS